MTILNLQQQLLKSTVEEAINELRSSLESCPSYWQRKSSILTAQAAGVIPLRLLKIIELEFAISNKVVRDIVQNIEYLHRHHGEDEGFRKIMAKVNLVIEEAKGTPFSEELQVSLNPQIFLDAGTSSKETPILRLKKLVSLATNQSKQLFDLYLTARLSESSKLKGGASPLDLIWFYLQRHLYDQQLGELSQEAGLIICRNMLVCCVNDAVGDISDDFFHILNQFGFSVSRPKDSWGSCARVLTAVLLQRQLTPSSMTKYLQENLDSLNFLQISQQFLENFSVKDDEELARFLLNFTTSMCKACDCTYYSVVIPANINCLSVRSTELIWKDVISRPPQPNPINTERTLGDRSKQYEEAMNVAKNVYKAFQKHVPVPDSQINVALKNILTEIPNGFALIAQSMLVSGELESAVKFLLLAIQATKDKTEQILLDLQLLQANAMLRKHQTVFQIFIDLFENEKTVSDALEASDGIFPNINFDEPHLAHISKDLIYTYATILFYHSIFLLLVEKPDQEPMKHIAASIIILAMQCCYEVVAPDTDQFLSMCSAFNLCTVNIASLIVNDHLATKLIASRAILIQGKELFATPSEKRSLISKIPQAAITKVTPFRNLLIYFNEFKQALN